MVAAEVVAVVVPVVVVPVALMVEDEDEMVLKIESVFGYFGEGEKRGKEEETADSSKRLMTYIPEEIIIEIFLRLPLKTLFKIRLVRKSWCKYLKHNTDFVKKQLNHSIEKNNYQLLYTSNVWGVYSIDHSLLVSSGEVVRVQKVDAPYRGRWSRTIQILGSCHGLICINIGNGWGTGLWNPATREYIILPVSTTPIGFNRNHGFATRYGFGYDRKINDYKVVRIVNPYNVADTMVSEVEVYTLSSNTWEIIKDIPYKVIGTLPGVFVNGALHWLANPCPSRSNSKFSQVLLSFNMSEEVFHEIPYLVSFEKFEHKRIDTLEGLLCMLCSDSNVGFEVWVLSDYGVRDSWTKLYNISRLKLVDTIPFFQHLRRIQSLRYGEILLEIQLDDTNAAFVFYDPKHEKSRVMEMMDPKGWNGAPRLESKCYTETYAESLVSLHSGTYVGGEQEDFSSDDEGGYYIMGD